MGTLVDVYKLEKLHELQRFLTSKPNLGTLRKYALGVVEAPVPPDRSRLLRTSCLKKRVWMERAICSLCVLRTGEPSHHRLVEHLWGSGLACDLLRVCNGNRDAERYVCLSAQLRDDLRVFDYYVAKNLADSEASAAIESNPAAEMEAYMQLMDMRF